MANAGTNAFQGIIKATLTQGNHPQEYTYTVGIKTLRIEQTGSKRLQTINLVALDTGEITLVFPYNHSYVRYTPSAKTPRVVGILNTPMPPGGLPPGIGPQGTLGAPMGCAAMTPPISGIPPNNAPSRPAMPKLPGGGLPSVGSQIAPGLPAMAIHHDKLQLVATSETTNLLGYACKRYEIRQQDMIMDIWATDQLVPFHTWLRFASPHHAGSRILKESWGKLLHAKKLFPLRVTLKSSRSGQSISFEYQVTSITSEPLDKGQGNLFQPPKDYQELNSPLF